MLSWLFVLLPAFTSSAFAKERIIWNKPNWPPYIEASGPRAGQGHIDKLLDYLQSQIPDTQFESSYYALGPFQQSRLQKPQTCNVSHIRTPSREKIAYFTAFYIQPPPQLVFREKDWKEKFYEARVVSLEKLLTDQKMHAGLSADRSYGTALDSLIQSHKKDSSVTLVSGIPDSSSLFNMLSAGKFDFTLEYEEVGHYMSDKKLVLGRFSYAEVLEQRGMVVVHISCSKTEWGLKTILKIDSALQKIASTDKYKHLMEDWHSAEIRQAHRQEFDDFYKKRSSGPWTNATQ